MANPGRSRALTAFFWALALIAVALGFFGVRALTRETVQVRVVRATYQTLSSTVSTTGKVEPVSEYQAHAPFPGTIQQIYVQVGQRVQPGTLLVQMNDADAKARIASAEAALSAANLGMRDISQGGTFDERNRNTTDLASAKIEQGNAATRLSTLQALLAKGAVSAAEVAEAKQRLSNASLTLKSATDRSASRYNAQDVAGAQSHVADARAALEAARNSEANVSIRSRIAGTVYSVPVSQYDFVPSGDDILDVADLTHLQVRAYFDEPDLGRLAKNQPVIIQWEGKPGKQWHGHIERAPTTVMTYGTRNVGECLITVDDPSPDLIPNTNVTLTVTEMQRANVLSVPREAWHNDEGKSFVYRVVDGKLVQTPVTVGSVNLYLVQIVSGISANDVVVLRPKAATAELSNGLAVQPVE